jgi:L-threonylcarbamoyladenylate synthase
MNLSDFFLLKKILTTGGIVAYPTETVYGLGCDPFRKEAVERIFKLKGRKSGEPPLLLIPNREWLYSLVIDIPSAVLNLMDRFWPGPLTIALPAKKSVPKWLRHRDNTVALRISSHRWVDAFLSFYRQPIVSTSANLSGLPPARAVADVKKFFSQGVDYCVDGGLLPRSQGSTIISFDGRFNLIREGVIAREDLW